MRLENKVAVVIQKKKIMKNTIGIIGAGRIGSALAKHFAGAGYPVLISNSRGAESLKETAEKMGPTVTAVSATEASKAEIIILSVPWIKLPEIVKGIPNWENKIVIDTNNHILSIDPFKLADLRGKTSGEIVSSLIPGANVIKAFNTVGAQLLATNPVSITGNRVIVLSGDNAKAKSKVKELISSIGFQPIDLGSLGEGGKLQDAGGSLWNIDLSKGSSTSKTAIEIVRRNTDEVQGKGDFDLFDEIFSEDFVDHTTQTGFGNDKGSVRNLYGALRAAFPDFHPEIHWMISDGEKVTTFKTYHGTHLGPIFGVEPTGKKVSFIAVDVLQVKDGKITDHWGLANLLSLMKQLGRDI